MSGKRSTGKTPPAVLQPGPLQRPHRGGRLGGGITENRAQFPSVRIRRRWFATLWLVPLGIVALVVSIAAVREISHQAWYQDFIYQYPGTSSDYVTPVDSGFPWLLAHFFNLFFMVFIIRAGLQILADHPRLYLNSGSKPDTEWLRLRGPVPGRSPRQRGCRHRVDREDDSVALPAQVGNPGFRHSIGSRAGGTSALTCCG